MPETGGRCPVTHDVPDRAGLEDRLAPGDLAGSGTGLAPANHGVVGGQRLPAVGLLRPQVARQERQEIGAGDDAPGTAALAGPRDLGRTVVELQVTEAQGDDLGRPEP